jgi:two-component sensor histidine kinase
MRMTLALRLLLITLAGILPMLTIIIYNEHSVRQSRYLEIHQLAAANAQQAALEIERLITGAENVLKAVAAAPAIHQFHAGRCTEYLANLKGQIPELFLIVLFDAEGRSLCRSDGSQIVTNIANRPYFKEAMANPGQLSVGTYTRSRAAGHPVLPLALGIQPKATTPAVVVAAALDLDWLAASLKRRDIVRNGSLTIADAQGVIIAREPFPDRFVGTAIPEGFMHLVRSDSPGTQEVVSQDGTRRIIGYIPAAGSPTGIYLSVGISVEEAFAEIDRGSARAAAIAISASAIALLLAHGFSQKLVQGPVFRIQQSVSARRKGQGTMRTGMDSRQGELEALGQEFDQFMDELDRANADRLQAEERRLLMTHELAHRLKNVIATIQSVAMQTFRGQTAPDVLAAFTQRLGSIATAHHLLLRDAESAASLRSTIEATLATFAELDSQRVWLEGPEIRIKPASVQSLAMALHELATNAVKYGALSDEKGSLRISWEVSDDVLRLEWREADGPPVAPPERTGFGTKMIERVLSMELKANVSLQYEPTGVVCLILAPVSTTVDGTSPDSMVKKDAM